MTLTLEARIGRYFGFPDDRIVAEAYERGIEKFNDIQLCQIGIFAALSDNEDYYDVKAPSILKMLAAKGHIKTSPVMLLKWLIQVKRGKDTSGNITSQIEFWAQEHRDDIMYSRVALVLNSQKRDAIEIIGLYIKHLELFWKDDLAWANLGSLYSAEGNHNMAAFAYEEAIALEPNVPEYYREAARSRLLFKGDQRKQEEFTSIALKQLAKAVMLDETDSSAWDLLIENTTDDAKRRKYEAYRKQVLEHNKK